MTPALLKIWTQIVGGAVADDDLDLAACALLIAELETPDIDTGAYLGRLDELAAACQLRQAGEPMLDCLLRHLFIDLGFRGNTESYYDPRNSCLDQVLDRKVGIPITLSLVVLEVGWRLGLDVAGIGFPGHFLVRARTGGVERLIDPFAGGAILDAAALTARLEQALGPGAVLSPDHLRTASKREILTRMLNNLLAIYRRAGDAERILQVGELLYVLTPRSPPSSASN